MAWTFEATERGYANLFKTATLKGGTDAANAETFANKIIAAELRYRAVQAATGVPWYFIGALHMRESSCSFDGVLHNGDRIIGTGGLTTRVPAGRGPFATWEASAVDALKLKDMHRVQSWSVARMLYQAEVFNGLGYVGKGINSPYVWAGTNHEQPGKYVADHVFDSDFDDPQLGVAAVLIRLAEKRPDIRADLYPATSEKPPMSETEPATPQDKAMAELAVVLQTFAAQLKTLNDNVGRLLEVQGVKPAPVPQPAPQPAPAPVTPPVATPAPTTPSTPIMDRPGVGLGALGLVLSGVLSTLGIVGPPAGESATTAGQLLPIISAGTAALGATGTIGSVLNAVMSVASMFMQRSQPK